MVADVKGSITKRGDAWRLRIDVGADPTTGRRRYASRTVHGAKSDAQNALNAMLVEAAHGVRDGHDATVRQLLDAWFAQAELAASTRRDYRSAMEQHLYDRPIARQRVTAVRAHHLDALYRQLAAAGLGAPRIHRVHSILRVAFAQAVRWQWIHRNPATDARPPSTRRAPIRVPSPDEMRRLIDAADTEFAAYLHLSALLGARRGEVCAFQWGDVDLEAGEVTISRALADGGVGVGVVAKSTKTDRTRRVALDSISAARLRSDAL